MDKNETLDCYGLLCPMPIIKLSQKIKDLKPGEVLEILSTDEGIKQDAPAWCETTGHEFLGIEEDGDQYKVYIKKK
ncbi:MAG: sulfurtransferase TusA family protein [bacterium]